MKEGETPPITSRTAAFFSRVVIRQFGNFHIVVKVTIDSIVVLVNSPYRHIIIVVDSIIDIIDNLVGALLDPSHAMQGLAATTANFGYQVIAQLNNAGECSCGAVCSTIERDTELKLNGILVRIVIFLIIAVVNLAGTRCHFLRYWGNAIAFSTLAGCGQRFHQANWINLGILHRDTNFPGCPLVSIFLGLQRSSCWCQGGVGGNG
mmetsp:Transcript_10979/g.18200  ORF Transcript_10979/g.18200 Transcript_10979/m.18200 type:complete len:206 (-) Transcript_10979:344-961(-)